MEATEARVAGSESFTYNGVTIGGAAPTYPSAILDHYMFTVNEDQSDFVCKFIVEVAPSGNAATDWATLATRCQAIEDALRTRYAKLTVNWGASTQVLFEPSVSAGTAPSSGFSAEPSLKKDETFPNSGNARAYEFRVSVGKYPNYVDSFGAAAGRRQVDVSLRYTTDERLIVTITGEWTQVPGALARAQFLSQIDGVSGYAAYRLSLINTASAAGATWALTRRDESDPNDLSTLRFTREYQQHVNGRRGSTVDVFFGESGQRLVTIRGTYLRTISGTGGSFGNVYGTAATSLANYGAATTGGYDYAVTQLAALTAAQGGPLTVGDDCCLLREPTVATNEQNDRTDYTLVFRELLTKQSTAAAGAFLDDPNVIQDSMQFYVIFNETTDSPAPQPASAIPGPNGSRVATGTTSAPTGGNGGGSTFSPPAVANPGTVSGQSQQGAQAGTQSPVVRKPTDMGIHYEAFIKKDVTDLYGYWNDFIYPLMLEKFQTIFGFSGGESVTHKMNPDPTSNKITADLHVRYYQGDVVLFEFTLGILNDKGLRVDPAFTGTPHEYLVQQALPKTTMTRRFQAVYKADSGFSLSKFKTPPAMQGWVLLSDAEPATITRILGIPAQDVPVQPLTYAALEESLIWVARNVGTAAGGNSGPGGNGAQGPSQPQSTPQAVSPATATQSIFQKGGYKF